MKTGSLVITMSTYSAHKGDSGADVGLDPAHAHATHIVAGHMKLEWVGGGAPAARGSGGGGGGGGGAPGAVGSGGGGGRAPGAGGGVGASSPPGA